MASGTAPSFFGYNTTNTANGVIYSVGHVGLSLANNTVTAKFNCIITDTNSQISAVTPPVTVTLSILSVVTSASAGLGGGNTTLL